MIYTTYDATTGVIKGQAMMPARQLSEINQAYIEGAWDGTIYYIQDGKPVPYPRKPDANSWVVWSWDIDTLGWQVNTAETALAVRKTRNQRLAVVDRVNPIWYASLTPEQQQQLQQYRQALLDIPQQPGFPETISWPAKPVWL